MLQFDPSKRIEWGQLIEHKYFAKAKQTEEKIIKKKLNITGM